MTERRITSNLRIEGAKLICRNFKGKKSEYNDEGNRNFGVLIDDDLAESLLADGWKVKFLRPREDDPDSHEQAWLPVKVKFGTIPPKIVLIDGEGKYYLDEDTVDQLDWTIIKNCDLVIRPYNYPSIKGRPAGVSAYLKSIYVTVGDDDFDRKYADVPFLGGRGDVDEA